MYVFEVTTSTIMLITYQTIFLYDIANSKWYTQEASGDVPEERSRFCAGAAWSNDESR
jgi:hypothetical protein